MNDDMITWDDSDSQSRAEAISKFSENVDSLSGSLIS